MFQIFVDTRRTSVASRHRGFDSLAAPFGYDPGIIILKTFFSDIFVYLSHSTYYQNKINNLTFLHLLILFFIFLTSTWHTDEFSRHSRLSKRFSLFWLIFSLSSSESPASLLHLQSFFLDSSRTLIPSQRTSKHILPLTFLSFRSCHPARSQH